METGRLVRVQGLGLDQRFKNMLDVFFKRSCSGEYRLTNESADLLLVDLDAAGVRDAFAKQRQQDASLPSILFSLDEQEYRTRGNLVLLHKPFTVRQLQSAFEIINLRFLRKLPLGEASASGPSAGRVRERKVDVEQLRQRTRAIEHAEQSQQNDEAKGGTYSAAFSLTSHKEYVKVNTLLPGIADRGDSELEYDPSQYLQGELISAYAAAGKAGKNAVLKVAGGTLTIDPKQALVKLGMGRFQLREIASFPLNNSNFKLSLVPPEEAPVSNDGQTKTQSLRGLIWQAALYAGRGRVPRGTDLDAPVRLHRWPNLTRLLLTPGSVRMSALWIRQPVSIRALATQLGLQISDVASFYSAAQALELYQSEENVAQQGARAATPMRKQETGLLSRILQRLRA